MTGVEPRFKGNNLEAVVRIEVKQPLRRAPPRLRDVASKPCSVLPHRLGTNQQRTYR